MWTKLEQHTIEFYPHSQSASPKSVRTESVKTKNSNRVQEPTAIPRQNSRKRTGESTKLPTTRFQHPPPPSDEIIRLISSTRAKSAPKIKKKKKNLEETPRNKRSPRNSKKSRSGLGLGARRRGERLDRSGVGLTSRKSPAAAAADGTGSSERRRLPRPLQNFFFLGV